jgi:hypothetical protein
LLELDLRAHPVSARHHAEDEQEDQGAYKGDDDLEEAVD